MDKMSSDQSPKTGTSPQPTDPSAADAPGMAGYRAMFEDALIGMYRMDGEGRFFDVNRAFARLHGCDSAEAFLEHFSDRPHASPTNPDAAADLVRQILQSDGVRNVEVEANRADGGRVWIALTGRPVRDDAGNLLFFVGTARDVSEPRRAAAVLQGRNRVLELMAAGAPLEQVLPALVAGMENAVSSLACSIVLPQGDGATVAGASPSVPTTFVDAVSATTNLAEHDLWRAVLTGETLVIDDLAGRPDLCPPEAAALAAGFRAGWAEPIKTQGGEVLGAFVTFKDTSGKPSDTDLDLVSTSAHLAAIAIERKRTEDAVKLSESRFRDFAEAASDWYWEQDADLRFTYFSERFEQETGIPADSLLGTTRESLRELSDWPDADAWREHFETVESHQSFRDLVYRYTVPDGDLHWIRTSGKAIFDENGDFSGYRGVAQDITAEVETREAANATRDRFLQAVERMSDGIAFWDADDRFVFCNGEYRRQAGSVADMLQPGIAFEDYLRATLAAGLVPLAEVDSEQWMAERLRRHREPSEAEEQFWDGRWLLIREEKSPDGGTLGIATDVTDLKARETELRETKEAAEAANTAKSAFLATMSHEIRTPMNGILGMASLLLDMKMPDEQKRRIRTIRRSGETLLSLLNDILDLSKIEAGRLELDEIGFDTRQLLADVASLWDWRAREKGVDFVVNIEQTVPEELIGDQGRIRQVLLNLVSNAVKFTDRGQVGIAVSAAFDGGDRCQLRFEISDTGIGIQPDALNRLFDKFTQADVSMTRRYGGTGLGLAICRQLVDLLGGTIGVDSTPGKGSVFWFALPCRLRGDSALPEAGTDEFLDSPPERKLRVLVAEDNHINQVVIRAILARAGHEVEIVENGLRTVQAVAESDYDLVLMDVQMPEMDGPTATRAIRDLPGPRSQVPIVALTANAMAGDREKYLAAGMNEYVSKPIDADELTAAIGRAIGTCAPAPVEVGQTSRA